VAALLIDLARGYALVGGAVAAVFVLWGIGVVDAAARGAWVFRPLLVPGVVLLWPLVLLRWAVLGRGEDAGRRYRPPLRVQQGVSIGLAVVLPVIVFGALLIRQDGPIERPAVRLEPPPTAAEEEQP